MANEVTETQQQDLNIRCAPSLKAGLKSALVQAGFRTMTEAILMLVRDFVAGRIQYKDGILQTQAQNSPN